MAVTPKTVVTTDNNSGRGKRSGIPVHYVKVGKGNRKGTAALIGGRLVDHLGHKTLGDFHIFLKTKVNKKDRELNVQATNVVFRTGKSERWQVLTLQGFRKRFPQIKI